MKQSHLSIDLSPVFTYAGRIDSILKKYFRVWASQDAKDKFIRPERRTAFNHIIPWSIDCQNLNLETSYAFRLLEEQLAKGVTDTKKQGEVVHIS